MALDPAAPPAEGVSRLVAAVATVGAVVLAGGLTASTRSEVAADLTTVVAATSPGAVLVVDGREVPAALEAEVPRGATVRSATGGVELRTGDRTLTLAPASAVTVVDGARQRLDRGSALVDALEGPALQVAVSGAARVEVPQDALVRLDSLPLLRVAAYRGSADVRPAGRRSTTEVDELHQVRVPAGALPGRVTPLALVEGDAWEADRLGTLVRSDQDLRGLAEDLATEGGPVLASLPAAERPTTPEGLAERGLALALAHDDGRFREDVYEGVVEGRRLGGSWGVVARLTGTSAANATDYIDARMPAQVLLASAEAPDVAGVLPFAPPAPGDGTAPDTDGGPTPGPGPDDDGDSDPRPSASPRPPSPSPSPSGPLEEVVETVRELLPVPVPAPPVPSPSRAPLLEAELEVDVPLLDRSLLD